MSILNALKINEDPPESELREHETYIGIPCKTNEDCYKSSYCCSGNKCVPGDTCSQGSKSMYDVCKHGYECLSRCCHSGKCSSFSECM